MLDGGELKPELAKRGIVLHRELSPSISFFYFNLDNPLVGGYTPEKLALRRAISMGYDRDAHDPQLLQRPGDRRRRSRCRPALRARPEIRPALRLRSRRRARAARRFGYKDRDGDGYRELPDGKPLTIVLASTTDAAARCSDELWKRNLDAIGVRVTFLKNKWPELNKMSEAGQLHDVGTRLDQQHSRRPRLL